jgi:hypothetical protein
MKKEYTFFLYVFLLFGCGREQLGIKEYLKHYSVDKSFEASINADSMELIARIVPKEFMGLVNIGPEVVNMPNKEIDSVLTLTEDFSYVFFDFRNTYVASDALCWGCADSISLESRINYLSDNFYKSVLLVSGKDSIECKITQLERTFKLSDKTRVLLGFDYNFYELKSPLTLVIKNTNRLDHKFHQLLFKEFDKEKIKTLNL